MAQLGSGNGTGWPAALDTKQTYANASNAAADGNTRLDAEFMNDVLTALVQYQTTMGTNPQGGFASLAARLAAIIPALLSVGTLAYGGAAGELTSATGTTIIPGSNRLILFGRVFETFTATAVTTAGVNFVTTSNFIPFGVRVVMVGTVNTAAWSTENGMSAYHVGTGFDPDHFAANVALGAGLGSNAGQQTNPAAYHPATADHIRLTAASGTFGASGAATVSAFCEYYVL